VHVVKVKQPSINPLKSETDLLEFTSAELPERQKNRFTCKLAQINQNLELIFRRTNKLPCSKEKG